jgi:hypothetical protein
MVIGMTGGRAGVLLFIKSSNGWRDMLYSPFGCCGSIPVPYRMLPLFDFVFQFPLKLP